jgi:hypothetical protein
MKRFTRSGKLWWLVPASVLVLAVLPLVAMAGSPNDRATGGGQNLVPSSGGAGNTVAFSAQTDSQGRTKGQFQYVDRGGTGTGQGQVVYHGVVTCLNVLGASGQKGGVAEIAGYISHDAHTTAAPGNFFVYASDPESPNNGQDSDVVDVMLTTPGPTPSACPTPSPAPTTVLDRGNVTIYKGS